MVLSRVTATNCTGGSSFGGMGIISQEQQQTVQEEGSFGGYGISQVQLTNCTGGNASFGGGSGGGHTGTITGIARLYNCRLTQGSFNTPTPPGKIIACIDGNDDFYNVELIL